MTTKQSDARPSKRRPQRLEVGAIPIELELTATETAWREHEPRARALRAPEVNAARVDVTLAGAIAMAGARNVLGQRERLVAEFTRPELAVLERVPSVALAAQHADLLSRASQDQAAPFADLLPRLNELRSGLLDDLSAQVRRKRAPASLLEELRAGDNSVRDKANDLNDLAVWYRGNWAALAGRSAVDPAEITEASELATRVLARLGLVLAAQTPKPGELSPAELRRRAFTLLLNDYEVVRRYGAYLFWTFDGGWEQYVPSLWSGRATEHAQPSQPTPPVPPAPPSP